MFSARCHGHVLAELRWISRFLKFHSDASRWKNGCKAGLEEEKAGVFQGVWGQCWLWLERILKIRFLGLGVRFGGRKRKGVPLSLGLGLSTQSSVEHLNFLILWTTPLSCAPKNLVRLTVFKSPIWCEPPQKYMQQKIIKWTLLRRVRPLPILFSTAKSGAENYNKSILSPQIHFRKESDKVYWLQNKV